MKIYMLDVTGCKEEQLGGYDKPIPCRCGDVQWEFYVIADLIDCDVIEKWRVGSRRREAVKAVEFVEEGPGGDLGFDFGSLPIGATITVDDTEAAVHLAQIEEE